LEETKTDIKPDNTLPKPLKIKHLTHQKLIRSQSIRKKRFN